MIKVTIEYHPSVFDPSNRYDTDDGPVEFTLLMEAICGEVFEEELDHVDVRVRQLTRLDESAYPVLITVDGDTSDMHGSEQSLADDFTRPSRTGAGCSRPEVPHSPTSGCGFDHSRGPSRTRRG